MTSSGSDPFARPVAGSTVVDDGGPVRVSILRPQGQGHDARDTGRVLPHGGSATQIPPNGSQEVQFDPGEDLPEENFIRSLVVGATALSEGRGQSLDLVVERDGKTEVFRLTRVGPGLAKADDLPAAVPSDGDRTASPALQAAIARGKARGAARKADILAQDDMLSARQIAERVRTSHQTIHNWIGDGKLIALTGSKRSIRIPDWQIDADGIPKPGLVEVIGIVGPGWQAYRFFMGETDGRAHLGLLDAGDVDQLLQLARLWTSDAYG